MWGHNPCSVVVLLSLALDLYSDYVCQSHFLDRGFTLRYLSFLLIMSFPLRVF